MILERNRIYPMDCVEVLKELPSESVDLVIADPPYYRMKGEINVDAVRIPYDKGGEKDKRKNPKGKSCGNVWEVPRVMPNYKEATNHPTQKPEKLAERMIRASSNAGGLVVIPFAGSGSEIVQCIKNGRDFIAFEINTSYVEDIILPRLKKETETDFLYRSNENTLRASLDAPKAGL